jgi:hypothetical protein
MDAWFAPDPDPFAFFVELQPLIMASTGMCIQFAPENPA